MRKIISFLLLLLLGISSFAQQEKYSKAKIYLDDKEKTLANLARLGITVDHGERKKDTYFISDFSQTELTKARDNGYKVEVLIDDLKFYYANQNKESSVKKKENEKRLASQSSNCQSTSSIVTPSHFQLGSMGGFYTYAELLTILDSMSAQFPNLITAKQQIDTFTSIEGRPLYWLKISDNPTVDEAEPQILYTALHHAREPASLSQMIFYMYYLLENYGTNPEITALVNNTEMYFMPCVNPDGYVYNETTDPTGGGMWRKNRRDNNNGTMGVDLNRNYGFNWAYDDIGSSPSSNDDTYRGPSAFSEPETQAIQWFDNHHQFKMSINYHSYGNDLIYPWGYIANLNTADSSVFYDFTELMVSQNHFTAGTGNQTVGYVTNGDSDDWGYGEETTKPKILSMTPEVGTDFWPPQFDIIGICENSLSENIYGAELIGRYADVKDLMPTAVSTINGNFKYSIQRLGLDSTATFTVSVVPLDSWIVSVGGQKTYSTINLLETRIDSIAFTLNSSITSGQAFKYVLRVNNGWYNVDDTITKIYGQPVVLYTSNCSSVNGYTSTGGNWGISTTQYVSAPSSITDSPLGNYANSTNKSITLDSTIDLTNAVSASLSFWGKWIIEQGYDYAEVLASSNGGSSWLPLCGNYTKPGKSNQDAGNPLYDGFQTSWVWEEMSLNDYLGSLIKIKFLLMSDQGVNYDGFYFDDLTINMVHASTSSVNEKRDYDNIVLQNIPNPASNTTTIQFKLNNIKNPILKVYNMLGETIKQEGLNEKQTSATIDVSAIASGTYFYQIIGEHTGSKMIKMVVTH